MHTARADEGLVEGRGYRLDSRRADRPRQRIRMTKIVLVRHGHVDGISPERFRGHADLQLTGLGSRQARVTAERIVSCWAPAAIYSSPLVRSAVTAGAVAERLGLSVSTLWGLTDIDYGNWQDLTPDEARTRWPAEVESWYRTPHLTRIPGGESLPEVAARTAAVLRDVIAKHENDTVVLAAHDSVNRVILMQVLDMPLSGYWRLTQDPCAINEIYYANGRYSLRTMNDTCHLTAREP